MIRRLGENHWGIFESEDSEEPYHEEPTYTQCILFLEKENGNEPKIRKRLRQDIPEV